MECPREFIRSLKSAAGAAGPQLVLVVEGPPRSVLRPVATRSENLQRSDVRVLTEWRNRFVTSFLTEFEATEDGTADWLVNTVGPNPSKILFMLDDLAGETFGYMGLDFIDWGRKAGEVDAVVRGKKTSPGAMSMALRSMISWAQITLGLSDISVRVRSDNPAIRFYESIGFHELTRFP